MINFYIMRHGEADYCAISDKERKLTEAGEVNNQRAATLLKQQNISIDYTLVSPYKRTQQTLYTVQQVLPTLGKIDINDMVTPDGSPEYVIEYLDKLVKTGIKTVFIISHMPFVGYFCGQLCHTSPFGFNTSSLAHITFNEQATYGTFSWLYR